MPRKKRLKKNVQSKHSKKKTCPVQRNRRRWPVQKMKEHSQCKKSKKNILVQKKIEEHTQCKNSIKNTPSAKRNEEKHVQCETKSKKTMPSAPSSTASPICTAPGLNLGVRFEKNGTKILINGVHLERSCV